MMSFVVYMKFLIYAKSDKNIVWCVILEKPKETKFDYIIQSAISFLNCSLLIPK